MLRLASYWFGFKDHGLELIKKKKKTIVRVAPTYAAGNELNNSNF